VSQKINRLEKSLFLTCGHLFYILIVIFHFSRINLNFALYFSAVGTMEVRKKVSHRAKGARSRDPTMVCELIKGKRVPRAVSRSLSEDITL